jgi:hypothetical protein
MSNKEIVTAKRGLPESSTVFEPHETKALADKMKAVIEEAELLLIVGAERLTGEKIVVVKPADWDPDEEWNQRAEAVIRATDILISLKKPPRKKQGQRPAAPPQVWTANRLMEVWKGGIYLEEARSALEQLSGVVDAGEAE